MAVVRLQSFGGIAPSIPPRYLKQEQAQIAINCPVFTGSIQSLSDVGTTQLTLDKVGTPATIYRFGQDTISDTQYWFHWLTDVDVARSQIAGDTSEWTFYTGDGAPKATNSTLALSGTDYPAAARRLGLPAPTSAPIATVTGTPDATDTPETRVYTFTWVSSESGFEVESAPSPASISVDVTGTETTTVASFPTVPTGDYNVTHKRIYRSVNGIYLFVAEITAATTSYVDSTAADALGEELPSLYWSQSPDALTGLINMPNGMMAGFVGRDVYFAEPYRPHAWPETYIQTVDYPVVGLGRMDTTLAVLTTGVPYLMMGSSPQNIAVVKSDLEQACVSKRSIVSFGSAVVYAAPDGLMLLSPQGSRIITENLFNYKQWQTYFKPDSIHAYQHDNQYIAFYNNGVTSGGFIYDMTSGQFILHDIYATAGFRDLQRDKLFLAFADRTVKVWFDGAAKSYTWKSKMMTMPHTISFTCAQVEAEAYPVTFKIFADGTLFYTKTVTSRRPFRLPVKVGRDWEFQLEGSTEVFAVSVATSMTELAGV